jgi:aldose 1-epimerase
MTTNESRYGTTSDGKPVALFTLENDRGTSIGVISRGATVVSVSVPDRAGKTANIVLGHEGIAGYEKGGEFFGCIVGRFANRIKAGRFTLDGKEYPLARNDGANHLHGGIRGFDKVIWDGKLIRRRGAAGIRWRYTSRDGEEGYPGTLKVTAEYVLTEENELSFEYWAVTDKPTPVNLTNHSYWNLAGAHSGVVLAQEMLFTSPFYLPVDETLIPTGEIRSTAGTPFDFSSFKPIGGAIAAVPGGYDHCLLLGKQQDAQGLACTARDPASGRIMHVHTTAPGVQFYTGNFLDGKNFPRHGAFCVETQSLPDSPNRGHFPSCILRPGSIYHHRTVHTFSAA